MQVITTYQRPLSLEQSSRKLQTYHRAQFLSITVPAWNTPSSNLYSSIQSQFSRETHSPLALMYIPSAHAQPLTTMSLEQSSFGNEKSEQCVLQTEVFAMYTWSPWHCKKSPVIIWNFNMSLLYRQLSANRLTILWQTNAIFAVLEYLGIKPCHYRASKSLPR